MSSVCSIYRLVIRCTVSCDAVIRAAGLRLVPHTRCTSRLLNSPLPMSIAPPGRYNIAIRITGSRPEQRASALCGTDVILPSCRFRGKRNRTPVLDLYKHVHLVGTFHFDLDLRWLFLPLDQFYCPMFAELSRFFATHDIELPDD